MIIKEIYVEVKRSHNYHTFTSGELVSIEDGDDIDLERVQCQARCRKSVMDMIDVEKLHEKGGVNIPPTTSGARPSMSQQHIAPRQPMQQKSTFTSKPAASGLHFG